MGRDSAIQIYVTEENKEWLTDQAEADNKSCSEYCRDVITDHIDGEQDEQQYRRYGVDQQIELGLTEIRDEATALLSNFQSEMGTRLDRIQRLRTVYVIALWRLVKDDYPVSQQKAAMKHAADHVGLTPREDPEIQSVLATADNQSLAAETEQTDTDRENPPSGNNE